MARDKPVAVLALARATGDCTFSAPRKCAACCPGGAYHRAGGLPWRRRSLFWTAGASEGHDANDVFESTFAFFYPPTRGVQLATCSAAARRVKMIEGTYSSSAFRLRQRASLRRALARWPFCRHSGASRHVTHVACCACSLFRFRYNTSSLLIACALWGKQWRKKGTPQAWLGYLPLVLRICLPEYSNFQSAPFYDTPRAASVSDVV